VLVPFVLEFAYRIILIMCLFFVPLLTLMWLFGVIQYRFLIDGVWRCDETKPCVRDELGLISNEVLVENNTHPAVHPVPSSRGVKSEV
jgi:hypothetical protein